MKQTTREAPFKSGFLAAVPARLRVDTGVALLPRRDPIHTAEEMCTLDWLTAVRMRDLLGYGLAMKGLALMEQINPPK